MKILLISPVGEVGGAEQVFLNLAKRLPEHDVHPILACLRPGPLMDKAKQQNLPAYSFQEHRFRQWPMVLRGIKWLTHLARETQADILHSNHAAHLYSAPAGKFAKIPELWHIHDYPYHLDALERISLCLPSQHVLFTTERVKSGYPSLLETSSSVVAPTCIDPLRLQAFPIQNGIRERYSLTEGPLFLTVTRLQEHKGLHHLIAAIPQVLKAHPDAIFAIVGKASGNEQVSYRGKLLDQISHLGLTKNISLLGYVSDEDLVALYREATALVHPATSEGYGLTLLEAMALGVPVIAAAADGPKEIIEHQKNGWLVPPADQLGISEAIITLLKQPEVAKTLSVCGQDFAKKMSLDVMVSKTVQIYSRMIAEKFARMC